MASFIDSFLAILGIRKAPAPKRPAVKSRKSASGAGAAKTGQKRVQNSGNSSTKSRGKQARRVGMNEASDVQLKEFLQNKARNVITLSGGPLPANEKQRSKVLIFDDGTLLSASRDYLDPHVVEIRDRARRKNVVIRKEYLVPPDVLKKIYIRADADQTRGRERKGDEDAKMRRDFFNLVEDVFQSGGTDIHIVKEKFEASVRVRVNGEMEDHSTMTATHADRLLSAIFYMADVSDPSYQAFKSQKARISATDATLPEGVESIRLQFNPLANGGRELVARILPETVDAEDDETDVDVLGYSQRQIRDIKIMRKKRYGLILISGATGSGKSTTLQKFLIALMRETRRKRAIRTIEDPPEYNIPGVPQVPVTASDDSESIEQAFENAISDSLRSDPDTIMIGEIREAASGKLAFRGAMTGHLMLSSVHANNAISTIGRLADWNLPMSMLSDHTLVIGLVSQRLVPTLCSKCKIPIKDVMEYEDDRILDPNIAQMLIERAGAENLDRVFVANENGCKHCRKGITGRTVVAETIRPDIQFMEHIAAGEKIKAYRYWLEKLDGMTLSEHAMMKVLQGKVDIRSVESELDDVPKDRFPFVLEQADVEP